MNPGVVGRVLIKKTACKKSRVSVPLRAEIRATLTLNRAAILIDIAVQLEVVYDFSGEQ